MATTVPGWTTLAEDPLVLVRAYRFGQGEANTLAIGLPDRKLMLVSPPTGLPSADLEALAKHGDVVAMVAINGAHHLGLAPCKGVFPNAKGYATHTARERIQKRNKTAPELKDIAELAPLLGERVRVIAADGCKIGDVIVTVQTDNGTLAYVGDFIANIQTLPKNLLFRLFMKLTDSAPGLKVFNLFFKFFVKDKHAARDFLIRELEASPPAIVVPGHGDVVQRAELGPTLVSMLRAAV